jgi:uncharacterized membrane protein YjgN (DUF898 family)
MEISNEITKEIPAEPSQLNLEFRGTASEFFRIWIVNIFLTIITFGIYSAWAKVRTRRYFLGNTYLANANFDFHANPLSILKGRIIVGLLFAGYALGAKISLVIPLVCLAIFLVLFPWIMVKSMAFNLRNTSHRGIRFGSDHQVGESYETYLGAIFGAILSFGIAFPWALFRISTFRLNYTKFGAETFRANLDSQLYFKYYYAAVAGGFLLALGSAFGLGFLSVAAKLPFLAMLAGPFAYLMIFYFSAYYRANIYNHIATSTQLKGIRFSGTLDPWHLGKIYITNALACIFSLGLLIPWALVRLAKYRIEATKVIGTESHLGEFIAQQQSAGNALGDAATDFGDIDLGF